MANKIKNFPKHMKVPFTFFCFLIPFSEAVTVTISFCICLQTYLCIFRIYIFAISTWSSIVLYLVQKKTTLFCTWLCLTLHFENGFISLHADLVLLLK